MQGLDHVTVSSLLTMNRSHWDFDIIQDLFNTRDQRCILNTPVRGVNKKLILYWHEEYSGEYFVKSAYNLLRMSKESWNTNDYSRLWKLLWKINAPPKVFNMIWRALNRSLPARFVLHAKCVPLSVLCSIFNGKTETIFHALISCPFAAEC